MQVKINSIYQSVFGNRALINVSQAPQSLKKEQRKKLAARIKNEFAFVEENKLSDQFRYLLRNVKSTELEKILYSNNTDALTAPEKNERYQIPSAEEMSENFMMMNDKYHYFPDDDKKTIEFFPIFFKAAKLIADYLDCNNTKNNRLAYLHAYKMLVLFGPGQQNNPFSFIEKYLTQHNFGDAKRPLHDALLLALSPLKTDHSIHLSAWRTLIKTGGPRIVHLFKRADAIEEKLGGPPASVKVAIESAAKLLYSQCDQYPELAELCASYLVSEHDYNKCLEIEKKRKKFDNLPDILIDGETVGYPNHYLVKLPIDDPRAYILGEITDCCQSIGGESEQCVISGITCENNGFYVLLRKKGNGASECPFIDKKINYRNFEIIGQGYAWLSDENNFVFDSWENKEKTYNPIITALLLEFAKELTSQHVDILRVSIGIGGRTPVQFKSKDKFHPPETVKEGNAYEDSTNQHTLYFDKIKLKNIRLSLQEKWQECRIPIKSNLIIDKIFSTRQMQAIERILLGSHHIEIWLRLFGKNTKKWIYFLEKMEKHTADVWILIDALDQIGLLTEKNLFFIMDNSSDYIKTIKNIQTLIRDNLLNKINFRLLIKHRVDIETIMEASAIQLFTEHNYTLIKNNPAHTDDIIDALFVFHHFHLLNEANLQTIGRHPEHIKSIVKAIVTLKENGLLTEENYKTICCHPKDAEDIAEAIVILMKNELLTKENYETIFQYAKDAVHIAKAIVILMKNELLTKENYEFILNDPYSSEYLSKALVNLNQNGLLTNENRECILSKPVSSEDLSKALVNLHKADLYNPTTWRLVMEYPSLGELISDSICEKRPSLKEVEAMISFGYIHPDTLPLITDNLDDMKELISQVDLSSTVRDRLDSFHQKSKESSDALLKFDYFSTFIKKLSSGELLTNETIEHSLNYLSDYDFEKEESIPVGIKKLYQNHVLTLDTFRLLFYHPYYAGDLAVAIYFLREANISDNVIENLVKSYPFEHIDSLAKSIHELQKNDLLSVECRHFIENNLQDANEYIQVLPKLKAKKLLTQEVDTFLRDHYQHAVSLAQAIFSLDSHQLFTQENWKSLADNPDKAKTTATQLIHDDIKKRLQHLPGKRIARPSFFSSPSHIFEHISEESHAQLMTPK